MAATPALPAGDPADEIHPYDFVLFEWAGDEREGEVKRLADQGLAVWEWRNGRPTSRVRGLTLNEVTLHPEGRPFVDREG